MSYNNPKINLIVRWFCKLGRIFWVSEPSYL